MRHASVTDRTLRWLELAMFLAAVVSLMWVFVTWRAGVVYQHRAKAALTARIERGASLPTSLPRDSLVGVIDIPRLEVSIAVREGDDGEALQSAAGHLPDTPLPWQEGNSALAGHRDTWFRPLRELRVGDAVDFATPYGTFQYQVERILIVEPTDLSVLAATDGATLTLITCYPFTYVGQAPYRFVVQARRSGTDGRTDS